MLRSLVIRVLYMIFLNMIHLCNVMISSSDYSIWITDMSVPLNSSWERDRLHGRSYKYQILYTASRRVYAYGTLWSGVKSPYVKLHLLPKLTCPNIYMKLSHHICSYILSHVCDRSLRILLDLFVSTKDSSGNQYTIFYSNIFWILIRVKNLCAKNYFREFLNYKV